MTISPCLDSSAGSIIQLEVAFTPFSFPSKYLKPPIGCKANVKAITFGGLPVKKKTDENVILLASGGAEKLWKVKSLIGAVLLDIGTGCCSFRYWYWNSW